MTIKYNADRLRALRQFMDKKKVDFDTEIQGYIDKLYSRFVPTAVIEFIDGDDEATTTEITITMQSSGGGKYEKLT